MTPEAFLRSAVSPALALLPATMDTLAARAMLVAIALQESNLQFRRQRRGPARSYLQFEVGGLDGVLTHRKSAPFARQVVDALDYSGATPVELHIAMEHNDVLACAMGRLLLYTVPQMLPGRDDHEEGWRQYQFAWRPGKPWPDKWPANYHAAWEAVA